MSRSVFPFPLLFRRFSTVFFIDSETNGTIPLHFRNVFHFLARNTLRVKLFSLNVCEAALQATIKGENFEAKLTRLCGFWLDVSFFSHREETSFAILIGRIVFFTCENHRSLLWLAITNLRTKIYDIAFWWVFLSMYIIILFTSLCSYAELRKMLNLSFVLVLS